MIYNILIPSLALIGIAGALVYTYKIAHSHVYPIGFVDGRPALQRPIRTFAEIYTGATGKATLAPSGASSRTTTGEVNRARGLKEPLSTSSRGRRVDDNMLIQEARRGNRAAFEELVRHYDQAVLRLALHLTGGEEEAHDVCQETFLKAYENIGKFRFECSFYTWVYRIATNLCLDHLRKKQVSKGGASGAIHPSGTKYDLLDQTADGRVGTDPERDLMRRELVKRISGALEKLTPRERMIYEMRHYHGSKVRTIGEILNSPDSPLKGARFLELSRQASAQAEQSESFEKRLRQLEKESVERIGSPFFGINGLASGKLAN